MVVLGWDAAVLLQAPPLASAESRREVCVSTGNVGSERAALELTFKIESEG